LQQEEQGMLDMMANLQQLKAELEQQGRNYMSDKITRGQIVMANLPVMGTSVQHGLRPCIIVSNNKANTYSPNVVLVPLTSRSKKPLPTHYTIVPTLKNGLKVNSTALAEQIITISKSAIQKVIGCVDNSDMIHVNKILKESISLF
jgi:mRNA interferase MazF